MTKNRVVEEYLRSVYKRSTPYISIDVRYWLDDFEKWLRSTEGPASDYERRIQKIEKDIVDLKKAIT